MHGLRRTLRAARVGAAAALAVGGTAASAGAQARLTVTSPDVAPSGMIPARHVFNGMGCTGRNVSPALKWSGAPAGTKSFAVTVYDPDAPTGSGWWHWVIYDIPAGTTALAAGAGAPDGSGKPPGSVQGNTDFGTPGGGHGPP